MVELFTLMGDKYIESFDEKSIMAHRLMGYKKIEYKNNIASIESLAKDIGKAVGMFPVMRHEGIVIHDLENFEKFFKEYPPNLTKENFARPFFVKHVMEWALDSLTKRARYYLLLEPNNWAKLKHYFDNIYPGDEQVEAIERIRSVSQVVYKNSMFSRLDYGGKLDQLESDFSMIDRWAHDHDFLTGDQLTLADFAVFAVLHLLFHPFIEETAVFKDKFPNMNSWAVTMDGLTKSQFTKGIQLKLI